MINRDNQPRIERETKITHELTRDEGLCLLRTNIRYHAKYNHSQYQEPCNVRSVEISTFIE